ncbi:hypothetical protein BDN71DRAFT_1458663 [Pleurotus eryngii]|uniref:Uncharacterized protein n=1 Tax=Pleurotus eryngii TaxID=5323 RepID=A0A9P5ZHP6_PLEER|nr:hypothetical protein BDN71DRAFT_1458663 [Pleurotus eryngii]
MSPGSPRHTRNSSLVRTSTSSFKVISADLASAIPYDPHWTDGHTIPQPSLCTVLQRAPLRSLRASVSLFDKGQKLCDSALWMISDAIRIWHDHHGVRASMAHCGTLRAARMWRKQSYLRHAKHSRDSRQNDARRIEMMGHDRWIGGITQVESTSLLRVAAPSNSRRCKASTVVRTKYYTKGRKKKTPSR